MKVSETLSERARLKPFYHQIVGVWHIVNRPAFFLADEMGAGKTKQAIDAALMLHALGRIDTVLIICPASVRSVWFDPETGELRKHLWPCTSCIVTELHVKIRSWQHGDNPTLKWIITNYDYVRPLGFNKKEEKHLPDRTIDRLAEFSTVWGPRTFLVLDESSAVKNAQAKQTKACARIRNHCGRVLLLNGTPIANNPGDLFAQFAIIDWKILGFRTFFQFRSTYAIMGGWENKQIVGWRGLEQLQEKLKPFVLRRLKKDCLDLPDKLPSVTIKVPLSQNEWDVYRQMRDDMVAELESTSDHTTLAVSKHAPVKAMRLAQITSGFIGGLSYVYLDPDSADDQSRPGMDPHDLRELEATKTTAFLERYAELLEQDPKFKCVVWCRFIPQVRRLVKLLIEKFPQVEGGVVCGEPIVARNVAEERAYALRLLHPDTSPDKPVIVVGTPTTGALGLNFTAANHMFYLSNDYSPKTRHQSEDRIHRPGQHRACNYYDFIAVGPKGQRTIDQIILDAVKKKDDVATWTTDAWVTALTED